MTNLYLSVDEFNALKSIPHMFIKKTRHHTIIGKNRWAVDVFEGELTGLVMAEIECDSLEALMSIEPPEWAKEEVTQDPFFTGGNLCRIDAIALAKRICFD
jgi:CYTH domain-containing protein